MKLIFTNNVCLLQCAASSGVFELQILEFSNYRLQLASGACCGGAAVTARGACGAPCRTRFSLCLKEYQSAVTAGGCSFGTTSSPVLGVDSFTLPEPRAQRHVLSLPFTFRWTVRRNLSPLFDMYAALVSYECILIIFFFCSVAEIIHADPAGLRQLQLHGTR